MNACGYRLRLRVCLYVVVDAFMRMCGLRLRVSERV